MKILVVDVRSTTAEISLYAGRDRALLASVRTATDGRTPDRSLCNSLVSSMSKKAGYGSMKNLGWTAYRMSYGGPISGPMLLTPQTLEKIRDLVPDAPLQMTPGLRAAGFFMKSLPDCRHAAFFETSYFTRLAEHRKYYALPFPLQKKLRIGRTGFHGIFHEQAARETDSPGRRVISLCMDRIITMAASRGGSPEAVSFGFTPLEGIMGERCCGTIDAGITFYLMEKEKIGIRKMDDILKNGSGFFGLTGKDEPLDVLYRSYGRRRSVTRAFDLLTYQITVHLGKYFALMGGVDEIVLGGTFGQALAPYLLSVLRKLSFIGMEGLSAEAPPRSGLMTTPGSRVSVRLETRSFADLIAGSDFLTSLPEPRL